MDSIGNAMPRREQSDSRNALSGCRCLVFGLGRFGGGVGATRYLAREGAHVTVLDQAEPSTLADSLAAIADLDVRCLIGPGAEPNLDECDLVVLNPAVDKRKSGLFREIRGREIGVTTEINLFLQACPAEVIGVTGSFGKSTVTAMLAAALRASAEAERLPWRAVHVGGNLGGSLLETIDRINASDIVVLELSSAQLEDVPPRGWSCVGAILTNLFPHHLERYDSIQDYAAAKLNLVRALPAGAPMVVGDLADEIAPRVMATLESASARVVPSVSVIGSTLRAMGRHNVFNASQVLGLLEGMGISSPEALRAVCEFPGLPHRLEVVADDGRITFVNDSKSTAPAAIRTAIEALPGGDALALICGGAEKGSDFAPVAGRILGRADVVVCSGESGPRFAGCLRDAASEPAADTKCLIADEADLESAIHRAVATLRRSIDGGRRGVVLLSPGAPSFDAYVNFEQRGEHFRSVVRGLLDG